MKIVAFSDIHGQFSKKLTQWFQDNPADLLLFAGDIQVNDFDITENFINWLDTLPYTNKILIFGNHDGNSVYTLDYLKNKEFKGIKFLDNESINIDGINIFGSPYSLIFQNWWYMKSEEGLAEIWKTIPIDTNILLTHTPPYGILDKTFMGISVGSKTLLSRIDDLYKLKYHIFGHVQEAYGTKKFGNKTFINASLLNEHYRLTNEPYVFDYNKGIATLDIEE